MSVRAAMRNLKSEVDSGVLQPFCFIETNGMKLSSPNNIYKVKYFVFSFDWYIGLLFGNTPQIENVTRAKFNVRSSLRHKCTDIMQHLIISGYL